MTTNEMNISSGYLGHFTVENEMFASIDPLVTQELCELFAEMVSAYMLATPSAAARRQTVQWRARFARLLEQLMENTS